MVEAVRQEHRIIVEGVDGSGKTTLISKLCYDFDNLFVVKNPLDDKQDFITWWPQEVDRKPSLTVPIHDRFFFSEIVYGPVLRGKINAPETLVTNIAFFLRNTALLIYCRPHSEILHKTVESNPQMAGVKENLDVLSDVYDKVMSIEKSWFRDRFIRYDWNNENSYEVVEEKVTRYLAGELS